MTPKRFRQCLFMLAALACSLGNAAPADPPIVLILYPQGLITAPEVAFTHGLQAGVKSSSIELEAQYLALYRSVERTDHDPFVDWLTSRYRDRRVDVVISIGDFASTFLERFGASIWPQARYICVSNNVEHVRALQKFGAAVVRSPQDFRRTVEAALTLFPDARQVSLIVGATALDRRWLNRAEGDLAPLGDRIRIDRIAGLPWDEMIERVSHLPDDAVALYLNIVADADDRQLGEGEGLSEVASSTNRPLFVTMSPWIGSGAVGGAILDSERVGRLTAEVVLRALENPDRPPPQINVDSQLVFDALQLRRWGIPESRLPAGSLVVNRGEPMWPRYRGPILAAVLLVAAQASIIGALLVQRRRRRRVEVALRASEETARASVLEVRDLAGRLISARESERARIARDLHDHIGQQVASVAIALSRVKPQIANASSPAAQALSDLERQTLRLSADLRHLSHELHPATLTHLGLLEALRERCDEFRQESGVPVRLDISESWSEVPEGVGLCLYRVAQEALRNVAAHSRARDITVSLDRRDGHLLMRVTDNGCGFDATTPARRSGLGLISLGERVRMLGGTLDVTSAPGAGTTVDVRLPVGEPHPS